MLITLLIVRPHNDTWIKSCRFTAFKKDAIQLVFSFHSNKRLMSKIAHGKLFADQRGVFCGTETELVAAKKGGLGEA